MKFKTQAVTLTSAEIIDESRANHYELKADVYAKPDIRLKYTVEICRQKFATYSLNQKYKIGDASTVMLLNGKCELLYDSVFYNLPPFTLANPAVSLYFFGGETVSELSNLPYYVLKKGLRSEKRRRASLEANPDAISTDALLIQRKSYGEWQVSGTGFVRFKLTLLIKDENGYFITTFKDWDKTESFGSILKHAFDLSVGEIVPVIYNPDNPADITVDYKNLKQFSFEPEPHIMPTEE